VIVKRRKMRRPRPPRGCRAIEEEVKEDFGVSAVELLRCLSGGFEQAGQYLTLSCWRSDSQCVVPGSIPAWSVWDLTGTNFTLIICRRNYVCEFL
jgi:hypothetical protein